MANPASTAATDPAEPPLITVGHGTAPAEEFASLLQNAGVGAIVDVRTAPGSRHNPQFGKSELARWLPEAGVAYRWEQRLGGWRKTAADSPDIGLRHASFRGYAGYMRDGAFLAGIADLLDQVDTAFRRVTGEADAATSQIPPAPFVAVMCSETVWWRCHRRMIADFVTLARGREVRHLMHDGKLRPHVPTDAVRLRDDGLLVYDVIAE